MLKSLENKVIPHRLNGKQPEMNRDAKRSPMRHGKATWILLAAFLVVLIGAGLLYWMSTRNPIPGKSATLSSADLESSIRAAAYLENNRFEESVQIYEQLQVKHPTVSTYKRNVAVAQIANIDMQIDFLKDPKKNVQAIRESLPGLLDKAATAIQRAIEAEPTDPIPYQLDVALDLQRISLLDPIMWQEEQSLLFAKLGKYVAQFPSQPYLVMQMDDLADSVSVEMPEAKKAMIEPMIAVCKAHPRNLCLLARLLRHLVEFSDPRMVDYVEPLYELLRPFERELASRPTPELLSELLDTKSLFQTNPEKARDQFQRWVNVTPSTSGHNSDLRTVVPNELSFVDLSDIQQSLFSQSTRPVTSLPEFRDVGSGLPKAVGGRFLDWNVDLIPEVLVWRTGELEMGRLGSDGKYESLSTLPIAFDCTGVVAADLYEVDSHRGTNVKKPETRTTTAGVGSSNSGPEASGALSGAELDAAKLASMRHEIVRDLIVYGRDGIRVVSFETPDGPVPAWSVVEKDLGLSDLKKVSSLSVIDWDADADLDIVCIADGKLYLRQNNGNRFFEDVNAASRMPLPNQQLISLVVVDYDRDVDQDVLVTHSGGVGVMENILHGQFQYHDLDGEWSSLKNANTIVAGEFDSNFSWDYFANSVAGGYGLTTNTSADRKVTPRLLSKTTVSGEYAALGDWNNDGYLDVVAGGDANAPAILVNDGKGQWIERPLASEINSIASLPSARDFDNDGLLDLLIVSQGQVRVLKNATENSGKHLIARFKGISDGNGGGKNNQYCVGSTLELFGPNGVQIRMLEDDCVHFGLGDSTPFNLRIIFTNGLTQNELDIPSNGVLEREQILKGSCPFLYGWDGTRWQMVTDLLWNAPLGLQTAKGKVLKDRRWEYLFVPGELMQPISGGHEIRVTEELWETAYFDHIALFYVDHPEGVSIYSNEKVGPPQIAEPGIWEVSEAIAPKTVVDRQARDWRPKLLHADRDFAVPFERRICQGLVNEHWLEYDFGNLDLSRKPQLYLTGWIYPTDTSLNIGIDQNPELDPPNPPSLWTVNAEGEFVCVNPFTGFPGGKPKTIVIPLDGMFATSDHRIRIQHSCEIYWDQAFVAYGSFVPMESLPRVQMQIAELHYRGFSATVPRASNEPHWYDYMKTSQEPNWPPMGGLFTRYGDVAAILDRDDDHIVVMGAGDEIAVRFDAIGKPIAKGWKRDFVLHSVGWDKDADLNTLEGQSSLPLPFSKMSSYPPQPKDAEEAKRIDALHRDTLLRKQDFYRFWKPTAPGLGL